MRYIALFALALFLLPIRAAEPDPKVMSYTLPDKINWVKGAASDTATLQGDPSKPGLYVQLTRWHAGNMSRPHTHPNDRYIYVISGTWWVGTGTKYDPNLTAPVAAGSYVVHPGKQVHWDGAKDGEVLLEIVGMGPATSTSAEQK